MTIRISNAKTVKRLRVSMNNDPEFKIIGQYMTVNIGTDNIVMDNKG